MDEGVVACRCTMRTTVKCLSPVFLGGCSVGGQGLSGMRTPSQHQQAYLKGPGFSQRIRWAIGSCMNCQTGRSRFAFVQEKHGFRMNRQSRRITRTLPLPRFLRTVAWLCLKEYTGLAPWPEKGWWLAQAAAAWIRLRAGSTFATIHRRCAIHRALEPCRKCWVAILMRRLSGHDEERMYVSWHRQPGTL